MAFSIKAKFATKACLEWRLKSAMGKVGHILIDRKNCSETCHAQFKSFCIMTKLLHLCWNFLWLKNECGQWWSCSLFWLKTYPYSYKIDTCYTLQLHIFTVSWLYSVKWCNPRRCTIKKGSRIRPLGMSTKTPGLCHQTWIWMRLTSNEYIEHIEKTDSTPASV